MYQVLLSRLLILARMAIKPCLCNMLPRQQWPWRVSRDTPRLVIAAGQESCSKHHLKQTHAQDKNAEVRTRAHSAKRFRSRRFSHRSLQVFGTTCLNPNTPSSMGPQHLSHSTPPSQPDEITQDVQPSQTPFPAYSTSFASGSTSKPALASWARN